MKAFKISESLETVSKSKVMCCKGPGLFLTVVYDFA